MSILVDTGVWHALLNQRDRHHEEAKSVWRACLEGQHGRVVTTPGIVAEVFTLLVARRQPAAVVHALAELLDLRPGTTRGLPEIVDVDEGSLALVVERFAEHFGRGLSFVDCSILVVVDQRRLDAVASFDGGLDGLVPLVRR